MKHNKIYKDIEELIDYKLDYGEEDRYSILEGSYSGHCCFEYTIVDSDRWRDRENNILSIRDVEKIQRGFDKEKYYEVEVICEVFDYDNACLVCSTLNGE